MKKAVLWEALSRVNKRPTSREVGLLFTRRGGGALRNEEENGAPYRQLFILLVIFTS